MRYTALTYEENRRGMLYNTFFAISILVLFLLYGCGDTPKLQPAKPVKPPVKNTPAKTAALQPSALQDTAEQGGYIYDRRGRRDPFIPLITPKVTTKKKEITRTGTLESYDMSEFDLSAIVKKGGENFALIVAPDNRSFTISEGTTLGLNKGVVEEITGERVVMMEHAKDYRGKAKPRKIILELHKGD